jgi:dienelactone hydrolase
MDIPPTLQAVDGFAAADYLRSLPNVRGDRIGVVGFSHGGWAVLKAVLESPGYRPFAAAVAFYPGCDPPGAPLVTDTLILIGDADDWTPARRCLRWREMAHTNGHALPLTVYPGALHSFDSATPPHMYAGHLIGRDPAAAEDAFARTREFLAERLMP